MEMGGEVLKNLQSGMSYYSVPKSTLAFYKKVVYMKMVLSCSKTLKKSSA